MFTGCERKDESWYASSIREAEAGIKGQDALIIKLRYVIDAVCDSLKISSTEHEIEFLNSSHRMLNNTRAIIYSMRKEVRQLKLDQREDEDGDSK